MKTQFLNLALLLIFFITIVTGGGMCGKLTKKQRCTFPAKTEIFEKVVSYLAPKEILALASTSQTSFKKITCLWRPESTQLKKGEECCDFSLDLPHFPSTFHTFVTPDFYSPDFVEYIKNKLTKELGADRVYEIVSDAKVMHLAVDVSRRLIPSSCRSLSSLKYYHSYERFILRVHFSAKHEFVYAVYRNYDRPGLYNYFCLFGKKSNLNPGRNSGACKSKHIHPSREMDQKWIRNAINHLCSSSNKKNSEIGFLSQSGKVDVTAGKDKASQESSIWTTENKDKNLNEDKKKLFNLVTGKISKSSMSDRKERFLPYLQD